MGIRRALGIGVLARIISFALNFTNVVVISRLLTPNEIGVFSVAVSFQGIVHVFREFGVNQYLVQAKSLSREQFRAAFSLTLICSWTIALILYIGSTPLASFYGHEGVASILRLLAINFLLMPFGTPSLGMLRRELRFGTLAAINVANSAVATAVTIGAAFLGESYLSMAWGSIAGHLTVLLGVGIARRSGLFMLPTFKGMSDVFSFGSTSSAATLIQEFGLSAPDLVLGRTLGFVSVAFYSRAAGLRDSLVGQITFVVNGVHFPTFAEAIRSGADPAALYTRAIAYLLAISVPTLTLLACLAAPLIQFFFGAQWGVSAPLATQLCLFGLMTAPYALANLSLVAGGHVKSALFAVFVAQCARIAILLTSIWLPLERVVPLLAFAELTEATAYHFQLRKRFGICLRDLAKAYRDALLLALMTAAGPLLLSLSPLAKANTSAGLFPFLAVSGLTAATGWVAGVLLLRHPLRDELVRALGHVRALRGK